ncbi:MAG: F0F1 ATP synthase subunit A [Myxococcales bacterium]|nr:F0F1 ATP synthase subunit A [Myxococcales bacterium]
MKWSALFTRSRTWFFVVLAMVGTVGLVFVSPQWTGQEWVESTAFASDTGAASEKVELEPGDSAAHGKTKGGSEHDHWWWLTSVAPGLMHNVQHALDRTWISGEPVGRVAHIFLSLIAALLVLGLAVAASKRARDPEKSTIPDTKLSAFTFFELLTDAIFKMMEQMMGAEKARATFPLVASLAVFILFCNLMGLLPGFLPPTDNLNLTLAMGCCVFVATHYLGVKYNGLTYFKHFLGPIVKWYALPLMILMLGIELISHLVRPVSLGLRLMGNMFGDHVVLGIFLSFNLLFVPLPLMALGLLVSIVQTLVFCLLSMVYISMAVEDMDHH